MRGVRFLIVLAGLLAVAAAAGAEPVVAVWYRGSPAGQPNADDLARIRARGFSWIVWPSTYDSALEELRRRATAIGLQVIVAPDLPAAEGEPVARRPGRIEFEARLLAPSSLPAEAWNAIFEDVQTLVFDPGDTEGTAGISGAWADLAVAVSRQLSANPAIFDEIEPAAALALETRPLAGVRVRLFETRRAWVVAATNTAASSTHVVARLPVDVPYAIWVSLIDGSTIAMLDQPSGPRWAFDIGPGQALVYLIDKRAAGF